MPPFRSLPILTLALALLLATPPTAAVPTAPVHPNQRASRGLLDFLSARTPAPAAGDTGPPPEAAWEDGEGVDDGEDDVADEPADAPVDDDGMHDNPPVDDTVVPSSSPSPPSVTPVVTPAAVAEATEETEAPEETTTPVAEATSEATKATETTEANVEATQSPSPSFITFDEAPDTIDEDLEDALEDEDDTQGRSAASGNIFTSASGGLSALAFVAIGVAVLAPALLLYAGIRRRNRGFENMPATTEANTFRGQGAQDPFSVGDD